MAGWKEVLGVLHPVSKKEHPEKESTGMRRYPVQIFCSAGEGETLWLTLVVQLMSLLT